MARISDPDARARRAMDRLRPKITARGLDAAVAALAVPPSPVDGDCLTWAPATAGRLRQRGYPAQVIQVAGWINRKGALIGFVHRTVLVADPNADPDPAGGLVVDVTARQFDPSLPARWLTGWLDYLTALTEATSVECVTRWPQPPT